MPYRELSVCVECEHPETDDSAGCRCGLPFPFTCRCNGCERRRDVSEQVYLDYRNGYRPFKIKQIYEDPPKSFAEACHDMQVAYGERKAGDYTGLSNTPPESGRGWFFRLFGK